MNLKPRTSAKSAPKVVEPEEAEEEKIEVVTPEVDAADVDEEAGEDPDEGTEEVLDEEQQKEETPVVEKPIKKAAPAPKVPAKEVKKFSLKRQEEKAAAKEAEESRSKRIGRNKMIDSFKKFLGENVEGMENLTNESAKQFLESIENWFNDLVSQYSLSFAGFYFGHYQKPCCFREPNGLICFIGPHEEIKAVRVLNEIKKVCSFDKDGKFIAGDRGQDAEGNVIVIPNKHDTEYIWPLYKEHLENVVNSLEKQKEKQKRREEKNLARASNLLK